MTESTTPTPQYDCYLCGEPATHWVKSSRQAQRFYCVEHSHGVDVSLRTRGHENVQRKPIGVKPSA